MSTRHPKRHAAAFIFDLDGTLVDSGRDIAEAANHARGAHGLPELPLAQVMTYIGDGVPMLLTRCFSVEDPAPADDLLATARSAFDDHYARHCLDHTRLFPGVLDVLRRLSRFPLMVATNKPRRFTDQMLGGLHIDGAFRRIVAGDDVARKKPDPEMILRCLEGLAVQPSAVAVVGDSLNDILAARAVGAVAVGCTFGLRPAGEIVAARPDVILHAFAELTDHFATRDSA